MNDPHAADEVRLAIPDPEWQPRDRYAWLLCLFGRASGHVARRSRAGERNAAEQRPLRATGRQLDADARNVLDHARAPILIRRSRIVVNSAVANGSVRGIAARTPCISQNAAV
jgi:hypothetical protein